MKFCKFCGFREDDDNAKFCMKCGKLFGDFLQNFDNNSNKIIDDNINTKLSINNLAIKIDKTKDINENYKNIIINYINNNHILSKRIIKGNPYIIGNAQLEASVLWYGRNMDPKQILLYVDDSMFKGITGLLISAGYLNSYLVPEHNIDSMELSNISSINVINGVVNINKGRYRLDFTMLNDEEFKYVVGLLKFIASVNVSNNISNELDEIIAFDYKNKKLQLSIPERVYMEKKHLFDGGYGHNDRIILYPKNSDKLENAIKYICPNCNKSDIFLIIDDTIFKSAKAGLVMSKYNIYIRPAFTDRTISIPWNDLHTVALDGQRIILNGKDYKFNLDQPVVPISIIINMIIKIQKGEYPSFIKRNDVN